MKPSNPQVCPHGPAQRRGVIAFTLIELMVVVAIIGILASILLPVLARSKAHAHSAYCQNNLKQLSLAWIMYADDSGGYLAYNLGGTAVWTNANWASDILDWSTSAENTNEALLTDAALGPYVNRVASLYRCPSDRVLSGAQAAQGWSWRARTYSMNAQMGNAGLITQYGSNTNNPGYAQYFKIQTVPRPAGLFVFIEEHPDSITDGYFINQIDGYWSAYEWQRVPGSYHNGGANLSFADGHVEYHAWQYPSTKPPMVPLGVDLPVAIPAAEMGDFNWLAQRMTDETH